MVVIVWLLDLQLPVQSVPITTKVVSLNPIDDEVYLIQHYMIKFVSGFLLVLRCKCEITDRWECVILQLLPVNNQKENYSWEPLYM
jgi:hypothetical protein